MQPQPVDELLSEKRYKDFLEDQTDVICRFRADGTIVYVNQAFCRLFGKRSEDLVGGKWHPIVVTEDIALINEKLRVLSPTNPVVTIENRVFVADGSIHWGQFVNRAFFGDDGVLVEIQSVGRDITEQKKLEEALRANEKEFRILAESMPQVVWITQPDGWNIYFNHQWVDYTGLTLEESYGNGWNKPFHPDDRQRAWEAWQNAVNNNGIYSLECRLRRADGVYRWWLIRGVPALDEHDKIYKWFGTCTDIDDIKIAQNELLVIERRLNLALEFSEIGVWDLDLIHDTAWRSLKHDQIFGYESLQTEWGEAIALQHVVPEDREGFSQSFEEARHTGKFFLEYRITQPDQSIHTIIARGNVIYDENAHPVRMLGTVEDITDRKKNEELIRNLAFYDTLTQLPNRRLLKDRLEQTMSASKRSGRYGALMFLDLDNFKLLNDSYGHSVGDLLLTEVARRISSCVREIDTVARFGGDEFVVILSELDVDKSKSKAETDIVAEKIRVSLAEPYMLTFQQESDTIITVEHHCTSSIGVTLFLGREANSDDVLRWTDLVMYQAKEVGRNSIRYYAIDV